MSRCVSESTRPGSPRHHPIIAGLVLTLVVLSACSADPTGAGSIDRSGRLPPGLSGQIAYSTLVTAGGPSGSTLQGLVHVVDIAAGIPRTVYEPRGKVIEGLSWAPDGLHLAVQTLEFRPLGPHGENNSIREIHLIDRTRPMGATSRSVACAEPARGSISSPLVAALPSAS